MPEEHISFADLVRHYEYETQVAALAFRFYEEEGRPEGRAKEHWRRAEFEIQRRNGDSPNESSSFDGSSENAP